MPDPHDVFEHLDREPGAPRMSDLWEWARCDYFAGESADVVCERHKLSRSQFFERAKREGWLRRDQPRPSAEPVYDAEAEAAFLEDALDRPPPSAYTLYRRAWAMVERAILIGRRVEAAGWTRLARDLRKLAQQEHNGAYWSGVVKVEDSRPESPDSPSSTAHPRGSGDPGLNGGPAAEGCPRSPQTAPHAKLSARSPGPRFRGDEREIRGADSPDSQTAPPLRSGGGVWSEATDGGGDVNTSVGLLPLRHGAEEAPRHLPHCAGEELKPDSPDSTAQQALSRLAFEKAGRPGRRAKRRLKGRG